MSSAIPTPLLTIETIEGRFNPDAPRPGADEPRPGWLPAPSPDDPHGACSRALVEVAVERDKARARASRLADEVERLRREWAAADRVASRCSAAARDANDRLDKVRALHRPPPWSDEVCGGCFDHTTGLHDPYPCETRRAADGAQ